MAFQLSDDVIDIASDTAQSGKTPGTDLREGVRTLPVLYALRSLNQPGAAQPTADARLRWLLEDADLTDEALLTEALTLLRGHHAMKESRADVLNWVHEARTSIEVLPDGSAKAAFLAMCDFVERAPADGRAPAAARRRPIIADRNPREREWSRIGKREPAPGR